MQHAYRVGLQIVMEVTGARAKETWWQMYIQVLCNNMKLKILKFNDPTKHERNEYAAVTSS